jgi:4-amino-4-deoxy-L-arabinose transferase-like glycosyltransferase
MRLAFWTMVGLGALGKGLADWALIGLPLISYALVERRPLQMLKQLFDGVGVLIAVCIFLPWYLIAEHFYPGFLNYFIVGEHFSRFLVPGWKGDRYGIAHLQPLGTIWLFWIAAIFPWVGVFVTEFVRFVRGKTKPTRPLERFLWCATLAPLVFFTFAHNIIWTYGLTAIVPFAIIVTSWLENTSHKKLIATSVGILAISIASILCAPAIVRNVNGNSERNLVAAFKNAAAPDATLVYRTKPTYSSSFYTQGRLLYKPDAMAGSEAQAEKSPRFAVVDKADVSRDGIPPERILFNGTRRVLIEETQ